MTYFSNYAMHKKEIDESCILSFTKKGDLRITKNYRGIALTTISANALMFNFRTKPEWLTKELIYNLIEGV